MVTRALCKLGMKRRFVRTFEWLTLSPYWGPLPQIAQRCAMVWETFYAPKASRIIWGKSASHNNKSKESKNKAKPARNREPPRTPNQARGLRPNEGASPVGANGAGH